MLVARIHACVYVTAEPKNTLGTPTPSHLSRGQKGMKGTAITAPDVETWVAAAAPGFRRRHLHQGTEGATRDLPTSGQEPCLITMATRMR